MCERRHMHVQHLLHMKCLHLHLLQGCACNGCKPGACGIGQNASVASHIRLQMGRNSEPMAVAVVQEVQSVQTLTLSFHGLCFSWWWSNCLHCFAAASLAASCEHK